VTLNPIVTYTAPLQDLVSDPEMAEANRRGHAQPVANGIVHVDFESNFETVEAYHFEEVVSISPLRIHDSGGQKIGHRVKKDKLIIGIDFGTTYTG
jgi:hypothetical protein